MLKTGQPFTIKAGACIVSIGECVEFSDKIRGAISDGHLRINLDLIDTREISGSFAGFLAGIINRLYSLGGDLTITGASESVEEVLRLVGFYDIIKVN